MSAAVRPHSPRLAVHCLSAALLAALALAGCQSTGSTADAKAETQTIAEAPAPAEAAPVDAAASAANAAGVPQPTAAPPAKPQSIAPAGAVADQRLEQVVVTGSRVGAPVAAKAAVARRAMTVQSVGYGYAAPAPPPPPPYYSQPANTEKYAEREDNPVQRASEQPLSTFSIDVDTGSYANVRRMLNDGIRPPADAVRAEEFINYFDYGHPAPASRAVPFKVSTELAPAPWNAQRQLLMIGIKGFDVPKQTLPPSNLVFLIDTSGSMNSPDKLPLLKSAFSMLAKQLRPQDRISIVVYAGSAGLVLPPTPGDKQQEILDALERLQAGGSTNGGDGIRLAYATARQSFIKDGVNRVILATDGDFNVGTVGTDALETLVADQRKSGIALTTLGFGAGNYNDELSEKLADVGDGNHAYIDTLQEARKVLVQEMGSTLMTIARDVKIQIEFNPAQVAEYRLIGYENRLLKREDFANDKVDAGDIGAGHEVTALYEITPVGSKAARLPPLRYAQAAPAAGAGNGELANLKLRYKRPGEDRSQLIETPILRSGERAAASDSLRMAAAVAAFADALRGGSQYDGWGWEQILGAARAVKSADPWGQRAEFVRLVERAKAQIGELKPAAKVAVSQ
ncbi:vWA domain-containing protein [Lysobacter enzymogenes]|uniref:vWA domain-containing protein n=1 Tax=Lysobacter enzymogenes TaxID=69 RepID=UPI0008995879|nr:VWA domain-containing protein [Lysobacter enzymogenes]SDX28130.1 Ca-activated chloride channel family protein [Lysobacter enzymogenes]